MSEGGVVLEIIMKGVERGVVACDRNSRLINYTNARNGMECASYKKCQFQSLHVFW